MKQWFPNRLQLSLLFSLAFCSMVSAAVIPADLKLVGEARLQVLWWKIFDAKLYGDLAPLDRISGPIVLKLIYLQDFTKEDLVAETAKQLKGQVGDKDLETNLARLRQLWPNIREQDSISFYLDPQQMGHFYHNGQYLGSIDRKDFNHAFLGIWLSIDGSYPNLARRLRGLN
ncbi:MAG: chalcone isomerase family protein [Motiliproteus sp.]|nr:chalcone isomerase family protein [Motiliproteus sp.]MCW9052094.1 chalcone isomerase family protein [Motiliproteus sp.]